ncbi:TIGR04222 domain-containing membrane protein [Bradyrhizobium sp. ORS 375]|uniref:TIGR04222 domain-containing membrane protein n=1 Tax=Bradyrhizobium sp. (strain ORS 375) TaxID=566679 RepID=UPI00031D129E|nr:TIGR04222 domain-containing membrane protein [Bradyrhizobium sp. ORS 375]
MALNPFDWTAGPFLLVYIVLAAIIFLKGFALRGTIGPAAATPQPALNELELAYLAGGAPRLGDTVLLGLAAKNAATFTARDHKITVTDQAPLMGLMDRPPRLALHPEMTRQEFQDALAPLTTRIQARLEALGYAPTGSQMTAFRKSVLPFVGALVLFGLIKVVVGASRQHDVGFLMILLGLTALGAAVLARPPTRTNAGNDVLRSYQATHARAARAPREHELLLAVALTGAAVLSGTAYASVLATSKALSSSGGGGCGGGGCSGGGCGGGGGGGCGGCS